MMLLIGNFGLCAAVLVAVGTLLVSLRAARIESPSLATAARRGIVLLAALLTVCSIALMIAMVGSDFRLAYVAEHTEKSLPIGYKAAAFWAGQEGSLLLWAWMLAILSTIFVLARRRDRGPEQVVATGALAVVIGFFAALMLFAANPFHALDQAPPDGNGLNPMLQDPGMIAHPPILFMGYAGFTIPFALLIGSLVTNRLNNDWLKVARPWVLMSWIFLGAGILLGAEWAYTVLGWGGYWAWDPVENASLLPWLTGTALLHSTIAQRQRGVFKRWNAAFAAATFILCILGTYITRSGIVDSVHTFGQSLVGTFFGVFLTLAILTTLALIAWRWNALKPERPVKRILSREGMFLGGNLVFTAMTAITLIGTLFPAFTRHLAGQSMSVSASFYNGGVLPCALVLLALMALAPFLSYGGENAKKIAHKLTFPLIASLAALAVLWALHVRSVWAIAAGVLCTVLVSSILVDVIRSIRARAHNTHESVPRAAFKLFDADHRRYGGHVVHAGVVMIVAGIAGSSLYSTKQLVQLSPGDRATVGKYTVRLDSLDEVRKENYTAVQAALVIDDASGNTQVLHPERRFYDKSQEASTQVAIQSGWREDFYVTLAGWEAGGKVTTFQMIVNPLVRWIWAGGIVLVIGGVWCLTPRLAGAREVVEPATEPKPRTDKQNPRHKGKRRSINVAAAR